MNVVENAIQLIGKTPLLRVSSSTSSSIYAKLESCNPGGSVKDRIAFSMIEAAEKEGKIKKGDTLIEPTSGNTGIGLAWISAIKGYNLILVMPDTMSIERQKIFRAFGAEVYLSEGKKSMNGSVEMAAKLAEEKGYIMMQQFENAANPKIHYEETAEEIWDDTDGNIDIFVAGIGTGGTVTGVGQKLKEKNPNIQIIGVEPSDSPVISMGKSGPHKIQGIGAGFVPKVLQQEILDEVLTIESEAAFEASRKIAREEGVLVGISAGANYEASRMLSERSEYQNKTIVTVFPDTGERYLSTDLFS